MKNILIPHNNSFLTSVLHESEKNIATVIMCHGFRGSKDGGQRAVKLADMLSDNFSVVRFDFSFPALLTEQAEEVLSVVEYVKQNINKKIILFGRSLGGCASVIAASKIKNNIKGLILWSMPVDVHETFTEVFTKDNILKFKNNESISLDDEWGKVTIEPDFYFDLLKYDLKNKLSMLNKLPKVFIYGEKDELVSLKQAKEAFLSAAEPKELYIVKDGDHRFVYSFDKSSKCVIEWLYKQFVLLK